MRVGASTSGVRTTSKTGSWMLSAEPLARVGFSSRQSRGVPHLRSFGSIMGLRFERDFVAYVIFQFSVGGFVPGVKSLCENSNLGSFDHNILGIAECSSPKCGHQN
jgi:hypothetical protein